MGQLRRGVRGSGGGGLEGGATEIGCLSGW